LSPTPHVVVVGAGFGGLAVARALAADPVQVTVVDRRNFHTFQPLLYQVATAGLEGESITHTVRGIFHGASNVNVHLGTVANVDFETHELRTAEGTTISWDRLVLAAGAVTATFGVPGVDQYGFGLKSLDDALRLRSHLLRQFELADVNPELIGDGAMTVVIVGGGPTGVELAGALAELFSLVLVKDYPHLDLSRARVVLVEAGDRLLPMLHPRLSEHARKTLEARGIEVLLGETVEKATDGSVGLASGTSLTTRTLVWAAGVRAHPLAEATGLPLDRSGRIVVGPDLRVPGHADVFVIGDLAAARDRHEDLLPQLAPVAMQQGRHVAAELRREAHGRRPGVFRYRDKGSMATIGRNDAVAQLPGGIRVHGFLAWVLWLNLHLVYLIGFRNRASVLVDWGWNYLTYDRGARIITEAGPT
jgi:NADH dehydrogenase